MSDVKRSNFKRFAYVPIGAKFFVGPGGTVAFTKIDEDSATTDAGLKFNFALDERCAWPIDGQVAAPALTPQQAADEEMEKALERCAVLVQAACDLIRDNYLEEYQAVWDEATCDGYCYLDDSKVALEAATAALASYKASKEAA